jgi:hypothetical protein
MANRSIGVALSGGGHRASLFGLGVLWYLVDAGKNADVRVISSVSGGSLTNGSIAFGKNFRGADRAQFEELTKALVQRIARGGTLWGWWGTWVYVLVLVALLAGAAGVLFFPWSGFVRGSCCAGLILLLGMLLHLR